MQTALINSTQRLDVDAPLSFSKWYETYTGIIPSKELVQYNAYLVEWYSLNNKDKKERLTSLRLRFLDFLGKIQSFFSSDTVLKWYSAIDLNSEEELLLSIPYFAKKLKDIALYYNKVRKNVKSSKIRQNINGTNFGIKEHIRHSLLNVFAKRENNSTLEVDKDLWDSLPIFNEVKNTINVDVIEYYDDTVYHDGAKSELSEYVLPDNDTINKFLLRKNLELTDFTWSQTSFLHLSGIDALTQEPSSFPFIKDLASSLLATSKYTVTSSVSSNIQTETIDMQFEVGKNFFYWPKNPYNTPTRIYYNDIPLSACLLDTVGNASEELETADTIFVKTPEGITGAWLTQYTSISTLSTMKVEVKGTGDLNFRFPYPGFGLSAEDVDWTKPSLSSQPSFIFLTDEMKTAALNAYWDYPLSALSCVPIPINSSTLASVLYPEINYMQADRIRTWTYNPSSDEPMYSGDINEAWLYRFEQTNLPLVVGGNNVIAWPYTSLSSNDIVIEDLHIPPMSSDVCAPASLSSIKHYGMIAGETVQTSDILYKIINYKLPLDTITEGAWLSGKVMYGDECRYVVQPGLNVRIEPGAQTFFVWTGDTTTVSEVFSKRDHSTDCVYRTRNYSIKQVSACNCKQVYYSSFGHNGSVYDEYNRQADYIARVKASDTFINLDSWSGRDLKKYTQSADFTWYKTPNALEWGTGEWTNNLVLSTGCCYCYFRANYTDDDEIVMPYLKCNYPHVENYRHVRWVSVGKNSDEEWLVDTQTPSSIILYPGNYLYYQRCSAINFSSVGRELSTFETLENRGSVWSNLDYVTVNPSAPIIVSIPTRVLPIPVEQLPVFNPDNVVNAKWQLDRKNNQGIVERTDIFSDTPVFSFTPTVSGTYYITVTATLLSTVNIIEPTYVDGDVSNLTYVDTTSTNYIFSNIPAVTAIASETYIESLTANSTKPSGFVLSVPLYGWDYSTSTVNKTSYGAKPFWARGETFQNFLESWGSFKKFDDDNNIVSQPNFSDIVFDYYTHVQILNNRKHNFTWYQNVVMLSAGSSVRWNKLLFNTAELYNLSKDVDIGFESYSVTATHIPSDIILKSVVDNAPTEIYYNAQDVFSWSVNLTPSTLNGVRSLTSITLDVFLEKQQPWLNLLNRFTPTIATLPEIRNLYTIEDVGGFFTPDKLGVSEYHGYATVLSSTTSNSIFTNSLSDIHGGYGLGDTNNDNIFNLLVNDAWLKEPVVSQAAAGNISKKIYKQYQSFIPYRTFYESNKTNIGLLQPNSRQSPWNDQTGGTTWGDDNFAFTNKQQLVNTKTWAQAQILKEQSFYLSNWCSDINGVQYGLYKKTLGDDMPGTIWLKDRGIVSTLFTTASGITNNYNTPLLSGVYASLSADIIDIYCFVDVLYIKTSDVILFERVQRDSDTLELYSVDSDTRTLDYRYPLTITHKNNNIQSIHSKVSKPWYIDSTKEVFLCIIEGSPVLNGLLLYRYNIDTLSHDIIFSSYKSPEINQVFDKLHITRYNEPVISYDNTVGAFLLTFNCHGVDNAMYIVSVTIKNTEPAYLDGVYVHSESHLVTTTPTLTCNLNYTTYLSSHIALSAQILPTSHAYTVSLIESIKGAVCSDNCITYSPNKAGVFYIPFKITTDQDVDCLHNAVTIKVI